MNKTVAHVDEIERDLFDLCGRIGSLIVRLEYMRLDGAKIQAVYIKSQLDGLVEVFNRNVAHARENR